MLKMCAKNLLFILTLCLLMGSGGGSKNKRPGRNSPPAGQQQSPPVQPTPLAPTLSVSVSQTRPPANDGGSTSTNKPKTKGNMLKTTARKAAAVAASGLTYWGIGDTVASMVSADSGLLSLLGFVDPTLLSLVTAGVVFLCVDHLGNLFFSDSHVSVGETDEYGASGSGTTETVEEQVVSTSETTAAVEHATNTPVSGTTRVPPPFSAGSSYSQPLYARSLDGLPVVPKHIRARRRHFKGRHHGNAVSAQLVVDTVTPLTPSQLSPPGTTSSSGSSTPLVQPTAPPIPLPEVDSPQGRANSLYQQARAIFNQRNSIVAQTLLEGLQRIYDELSELIKQHTGLNLDAQIADIKVCVRIAKIRVALAAANPRADDLVAQARFREIERALEGLEWNRSHYQVLITLNRLDRLIEEESSAQSLGRVLHDALKQVKKHAAGAEAVDRVKITDSHADVQRAHDSVTAALTAIRTIELQHGSNRAIKKAVEQVTQIQRGVERVLRGIKSSVTNTVAEKSSASSSSSGSPQKTSTRRRSADEVDAPLPIEITNGELIIRQKLTVSQLDRLTDMFDRGEFAQLTSFVALKYLGSGDGHHRSFRAFLKSLKKASNLTRVVINRNQFTGDYIRFLVRSLPNVTHLDLRKNKFEEINLSNGELEQLEANVISEIITSHFKIKELFLTRKPIARVLAENPIEEATEDDESVAEEEVTVRFDSPAWTSSPTSPLSFHRSQTPASVGSLSSTSSPQTPERSRPVHDDPDADEVDIISHVTVDNGVATVESLHLMTLEQLAHVHRQVLDMGDVIGVHYSGCTLAGQELAVVEGPAGTIMGVQPASRISVEIRNGSNMKKFRCDSLSPATPQTPSSVGSLLSPDSLGTAEQSRTVHVSRGPSPVETGDMSEGVRNLEFEFNKVTGTEETAQQESEENQEQAVN